MQEDSKLKKEGNISAILLPPHQLSHEEKENARDADQGFNELLELAKKEYDRLEQSPKEFYLVLANPPSISLPEEHVEKLMQSLGSTKELNGSWLPVVVKSKDHFFRVWGKTAYCG